MTEETARKISKMMLQMGLDLNESAILVQDTESQPEFVRYRKALGNILSEMLTEVLNPIFAERPELAPEEMRSAFLPRPGETK
jgi:hypothetical protein